MVQKPGTKLNQRQKDVPKVLVVCQGNICRSPLSGIVLAKILGADTVRDRGFGKSGRIAALKIREYAAEIGYDLSNHRSETLDTADIDWADLIVYMDGGNLRRLYMSPVSLPNLLCLGNVIGADRIPDPNYLPRGSELRAILRDVVKASEALGLRLRQDFGRLGVRGVIQGIVG